MLLSMWRCRQIISIYRLWIEDKNKSMVNEFNSHAWFYWKSLSVDNRPSNIKYESMFFIEAYRDNPMLQVERQSVQTLNHDWSLWDIGDDTS